MIRINRTPEYRLIIPGRAVSFRSPKAKTYKALVQSIARDVFTEPLLGARIEVRIDYFHVSNRRLDMDNVAKCILDALNSLAYIDDRQVRLQSSTAHSLAAPVHISEGIVDVVKPLAHYDEYVFTRIRSLRD
jgi:Holliday junction resolvase RusA-like endonuclease